MYAYHATTKQRLPSIRRNGLVPRPQEQPDEQRGTDDPAVFFSISPQHALVWGSVILRFPWPEEAEPDPYSDTTIYRGEVLETNWFTTEAIAPETIDVWRNAAWHPLRRSR